MKTISELRNLAYVFFNSIWTSVDNVRHYGRRGNRELFTAETIGGIIACSCDLDGTNFREGF